MTIDEAIEYYIKAANQRAIADEEMGVNDNSHWNETKFMTKKQSEQIIADNRQLAEWLTELKEARKLLTATKYKVEHEEWDMHGEHYIGDYALCPNCDKCFTNIYNGKATPVVAFCPDCGQKIDWS